MKKIITMTHFNRPLYTDMCLNALERCDGVAEYELIAYVEPSDTKVGQILESYKARGNLRLDIVYNKERRYNSLNIMTAMKHGFLLSDYVIHVEDDIILAKDALSFFEWGKDQRTDKIVNVCGYTRRASDKDCKVWENYHKAVTRRWFVPWGWATWKDMFEKMCEMKLWNDDPGFDVNINHKMQGYEIFPWISRTQNVGGLSGFHVESARWHYENHFTPVWIESFAMIKHYLPETQWSL